MHRLIRKVHMAFECRGYVAKLIFILVRIHALSIAEERESYLKSAFSGSADTTPSHNSTSMKFKFLEH